MESEIPKIPKGVRRSLYTAFTLIGILGISVVALSTHRSFLRPTPTKEESKVWVLPEYKHVAEVAEFEITAYDAYSSQSINVAKYRDGRTALNRPAVSGYTIAVDPRIIPFDSFVYLPGMGWRVAEDVGGAIKGYRIDVLMETKKQAMKFGRQKLHALWIPPKPGVTKIKKKVVKKQTIPKKKKIVKPKKTTKK